MHEESYCYAGYSSGGREEIPLPPLILGSFSFDIGSVRGYYNWLVMIRLCYVIFYSLTT